MNSLPPLQSLKFSPTGEETRAARASRTFALILFAMIVVALLASLVLGTSVYRSLADARADAGDARLESSLLLNNVRMNDEIDAIALGTGPEGRALVLSEHLDSGNYETRIYAYNGSILQEYAVAGSPYTPGRASKITDSETFDFGYENGLLTIHTDTGDTSIALRSVRGGA